MSAVGTFLVLGNFGVSRAAIPPIPRPPVAVLVKTLVVHQPGSLLWGHENTADNGTAPAILTHRGPFLFLHRCRREWCWNWVTRSPAFREYPVRPRGQSADRWAWWQASSNHQPCAC